MTYKGKENFIYLILFDHIVFVVVEIYIVSAILNIILLDLTALDADRIGCGNLHT